MKKETYIVVIIGILIFFVVVFIGFLSLQKSFRGVGSLTGRYGLDYPYFITIEPMTIKKIVVPIGTKLTYEGYFFKKGRQNKLMEEEKLFYILLPEGKTINWGGVPVYMIKKFLNSEMHGYSVYPDFDQLEPQNESSFSRRWNSCNSDLGVLVKHANDWSFNTQNIVDLSSCSVIYLRYFKNNNGQQQFLDNLLNDLRNVNPK